MSADRISLDANILFYTIDVDAGERHERAKEIVTRSARDFDCILRPELPSQRSARAWPRDDGQRAQAP